MTVRKHEFSAEGVLTTSLALTALRNQLSVKPHEGNVQAADERLLLVKAWMDASPGAQDILDVWDQTNTVRR